MRTSKITALAVAGALGAAGLGAVVVGGPALAAVSATATQDSTTPDDAVPDDTGWVADRLAGLKDALSGLVGDGTITQEQADKVAETLNESGELRGPGGGHGHGGPGHLLKQGLDAAATALGLTETEVLDALRDGQSLAEVAAEEGVDVQAVVDALVAEAEQALADAVDAGRLTQDQADEFITDLPMRVEDMVNNARPMGGGRGHGPGGFLRPGLG